MIVPWLRSICMKHLILISFMILLGSSNYAQEIPESQGLFIGERKISYGLSLRSAQIPKGNFTLREVNFEKEDKREVNLVAMMQKKRLEQEKSYIELSSPVPSLSSFEKQVIQVSNDLHIHNRSSNLDMYTGKKKIPAYEEFRTPDLFNRSFSPFIQSGVTPSFHYSPFFR